jgi:DNA replicative helicase MCM subunit Mcm2 (Cdc46/Mcm family)
MDPNDQVAIHEAMEQQTMSIAKAGIQATVNARTSILAAANPVFGRLGVVSFKKFLKCAFRYDRTKTLKANVNISAPIMSRFDLFFIIWDECNPVIDEMIARHIIKGHSSQLSSSSIATEAPFTVEQLKKYIQHARNINPRFTSESNQTLVECYRLLRQNDLLGKNNTAYRITVRQLESLIRLSESLARLHLSTVIQSSYVREAYRLLQKSIICVETQDIELDENEENMDLITREMVTSQVGNQEPSLSYRDEREKRKNSDDHDGYSEKKRKTLDSKIIPPSEIPHGARHKSTKRKLQMSSVEYDDITSRILVHLKKVVNFLPIPSLSIHPFPG